jgi:hypothetical protein
LLAFLSGCVTDPASEDLVGSWRTAPEDLSPSGWYQSRLSFNVFGVFESEVRDYGLYPGQDRNALSAYSRIEGTYRVEGDRLIFRTSRMVWWDRFYGARSPEQVEEPYHASLYDDARYTVQGDRLILQYLSYPFDAPVPTSWEFTREH